jgi:lipoprotein-anchoring transpeptidase ErfK/SrfK
MQLKLFVKVLALASLVATIATGADASLLIKINKSTQRMQVIVDGQPRYSWKVSTGKLGYGTPSGTYTPFRMEPDHFSKEWDDAPMPHSIFFTGRGHAIHGSYYTKRLGRAVSHGCVRLAPGNAAVLYGLVAREGMGNTRIVISGGMGGFAEEFAPVGQEVKRIVPKVKKQFGDWLQR